VPFTTVIVSEEEGAAKLRALTGKQEAPVLQVGDKQVITGFNAPRWQSVLDNAGYPKTAPPVRAAPTRAATSTATGAPAAANAAAPSADNAPPPPPARGTDYPK